MNTEPFNKKAFFVIGGCMIIAFLTGTNIASFVVVKIAPYYFFGVEEVNKHSIKVAVSAKQTIVFSNGVTIEGVKLLPLSIAWGVLFLIMTFIFWALFVKIAVWLLNRCNPNLAKVIHECWKYKIWKRHQNGKGVSQ